MSYFPEVAWGAIAKNVIPLYQEGVFQLNKYLIDVTPLDVNEPGAMLMSCIVGDNFIDFLGYVYRIDNIESTAYGLKLLLYDINERSVSEYINYGPYQDRIGYIYRPTKYGIILSQAQILKLDSQARDRIGNIEKGVIWENLFHIDQTYPQTIFGGVPLFSSGLYTDFIDFNLESEIESQEGRLSWDNDAGTLKLGLPGGNVTGQLFQEMLEKVKNESGATIANGKVIYVSGAVGRNIKIGLGDSTDYLKSFIFGVTTEEIANNGFGYICTRGKVGGVNTSSWEVNDKLWLTTNGNMSNIPPEAPGIKVFVGVVLIKHATEGVIDIKPTFIPRMSGLSDVYGTPSLDGQVYSWDTTEQRFILRNLIDSYWEQTPTTYELTYSDGEVFALNSMTVDSIITIGKASFLEYSTMKLQLGVDPIDNSYGLSQINNLYSSKIAAYASDGKIIYGRESGESGITLDRNSSTFYYVGFNNNNPTYPYHFKNGTVVIDGPSYGSGSLAFLNSSYGNVTPHYIGQRSYADGSKGIAISDGTIDLAYFDIAKNDTIFNGSIHVNSSVNVTGNLNITGDINRYNQTELNIGDTFINLGTAQETAINGGIRLYNANGSTLITKLEYNISNSRWIFDKSILANKASHLLDFELCDLIIRPTSLVDNETTISIALASSTSNNLGYTINTLRTENGHGNFDIRYHPKNNIGVSRLFISQNGLFGFNNNNPTYPYHFKDGTVAIEGQTYANGSLAFLNSSYGNVTPHYIGQRSHANGSKGIAIGDGTTDLVYFDIANSAIGLSTFDIEAWHVNFSIMEAFRSNIMFSKTSSEMHLNSNSYYTGTWQYKSSGMASNYALKDGEHRFRTAAAGIIDTEITWNYSLKVSQNGTFVDKKLFIGITSPPSVDTSGTLNSLVWDSSTGEVKQRNISGCGLLLGETSATAYRGDRGKTAYDHSQATGNPHNTTFASITSKPTTLSGYGITDAYTKNNLQTSGGASVHWNNITNTPSTYTPAEHSHNYAGSITPSGTANSALLIKGTYTSLGGQQPPAYISSGYVRFNMMNTIINNNTSYKDFLLMDTYKGSDVPWVTAFGVAKSVVPKAFIMTGPKNGEEWASTAELLSTYNYATYTLPASLKGAANGLAELDSGGKVPSSQLPSYVDDVLEYTTFSLLPSVGESGKIYITTDTNKTYRWSGSVYTEISPSLALGETSATAYRGDRGKIAYDHSQSTGNPHSTTFAQLGLKPTTLAGYGITDAATSTHTHTFASITSKPTTLAGYGITDATPSSINNGHYITDGVNLTGTYVSGSIRMSTQSGATGYPSAHGITYTFDATTPSRVFSIFTPKLSNDLYIQKYSDSSVGLGWYKIFTTANLNPSNYLTKRYEPYSELTYGSSIIWDCSTGLNKTLTASGNFTINLTNLENGMSGDLRITSSTIITITLPSSSKLNGNVSNLPAGIYHLAWVYNGSVLDFNIALYE